MPFKVRPEMHSANGLVGSPSKGTLVAVGKCLHKDEEPSIQAANLASSEQFAFNHYYAILSRYP